MFVFHTTLHRTKAIICTFKIVLRTLFLWLHTQINVLSGVSCGFYSRFKYIEHDYNWKF